MKHDLDQIQQRVSLDDVLAAAGSDPPNRQHKIRCPFHGDKTASCKLYRDGHFHCFGCGKTGDIFALHMHLNHLPFSDAVKSLASMAGFDTTTAPRIDPSVAKARVVKRQTDHTRYLNRVNLRMRAAMRYAELSHLADQVGAVLRFNPAREDVWDWLAPLYEQRDRVENVEWAWDTAWGAQCREGLET